VHVDPLLHTSRPRRSKKRHGLSSITSTLSSTSLEPISLIDTRDYLLLDLSIVNDQALHSCHPVRHLIRSRRVQLQMDLVCSVVVLSLQSLRQQEHLLYHWSRDLLVVQHVKQHVQLLFCIIQWSLGSRLDCTNNSSVQTLDHWTDCVVYQSRYNLQHGDLPEHTGVRWPIRLQAPCKSTCELQECESYPQRLVMLRIPVVQMLVSRNL